MRTDRQSKFNKKTSYYTKHNSFKLNTTYRASNFDFMTKYRSIRRTEIVRIWNNCRHHFAVQREQLERPLCPAQRERIVETGGRATGHIGNVFHMFRGAGSLAQTIEQPRIECAEHCGFAGDGLLEGFVVLDDPSQTESSLQCDIEIVIYTKF